MDVDLARACLRGYYMGYLLLRLLSQASQHIRRICKMRQQQGREDVRRMVVPALRRSKGNVRLRISICELHRMQPARTTHAERRLQASWNQKLSHLAIQRWIT